MFAGLSIVQNGPLPTFIKNFDSVIENPTKSQKQFLEGLNEVGLCDVRHLEFAFFKCPRHLGDLIQMVSVSSRALTIEQQLIANFFLIVLTGRLIMVQ